MPTALITLLTDFGGRDPFVAAMKGVILSIRPKATIVDLTHEIPPHGICEAAFTLKSVYRYFPKGTIHVVVVDPGVGGSRRPLLAVNRRGRFIAPDNGVLSYIYRDEPSTQVYQLNAQKYRLKTYSPTFDGRDLFAPAAAWLSKSIAPEKIGRRVTDYIRFPIPEARRLKKGRLEGQVIHIDRFGNLITNITRMDIEPWLSAGKMPAITIKGRTIKGLKPFYSQAAPGKLSALINNDDHLEIFCYRSSAQLILKNSNDEPVTISWEP
ncbi:MAG: SAM-dependent chlorinase/fluorinase [Nitrospirae bacterium]|nr:SAM-dependent chlorinase/fluorinase [Nitrospirota bacterium]